MNNTPETDKNTWSDSCDGVMHEVVNASFARRMEIERNKWRDCANKLVESSGWHDQWPQAVAHYRKLKAGTMSDYTFESQYWGDCCNTFDEDQKHYVYARFMGLHQVGYGFSLSGKSVIDIGGGPTSMLLKAKGLGRALVVDPLQYPQWTYARYHEHGVECLVMRGEDVSLRGFDECWIYNCLQHTDDPALIIRNALQAARVLRIFEWVDIEPHDGHPQMITKKMLDEAIGREGKLIHLAESGCFGLAYFNIYTQ